MAKYSKPTKSTCICGSCTANADVQSVKIAGGGDQKHIITSTNCCNCHTRENAFYTDEPSQTRPIRITCNFDCMDDLKRYVSLYQYADLMFIRGEIKYNFTSSCDIINVVGGLLLNAIEEISDAYGIKRETIVEKHKIKTSLYTEFMNSSSSLTLSSASDKMEAEVQVENLQSLLDDCIFTMIITDPKGMSRVSPVDKKISECEFSDLQTFNDEKVFHEWIE
ncbi:hypothetical protein TCON_0263 [Astathelohania contejeani]|uniref:Uncharacterized protein n=1 Tax=Astathelohania contejeani TaxID=164912 RepID=A0ABQ7I256_9MICR|nr:hypothetical protein TCON_0263 [Thelohania contejeani]